MDFGTKLRNLMKRAGLRQEDVAASFDTSQSVVSSWLNGVMPRVPTLLRLARMLDTTVDYLVDPNAAAPEFSEDERAIIRFVRDTGLSREEVMRRLALVSKQGTGTVGRPLDPSTGEALDPPRRNGKKKA